MKEPTEIFEYGLPSLRTGVIKAMASGILGIILGFLFSFGKTFGPEAFSFVHNNDLAIIAIGYLIPGAIALYLIYMHRVRDPILGFYIGISSISLFQWFGLLNLK